MTDQTIIERQIMYQRPIKLRDRIFFTQVLTQADYVVHALTAIDVNRCGVTARGSFEHHGETVEQVEIATHSDTWTVAGRPFAVTMLAGGLFTLTEAPPAGRNHRA